MELIQAQVAKFGFPPSPLQLGTMGLIHRLFPRSSPTSGVPTNSPTAGVARDSGTGDSAVTSRRWKRWRVLDPSAAEAGEGTAKASGEAAYGEEFKEVFEEKVDEQKHSSPTTGAQQVGATVYRWYSIPWIKGSSTCGCIGNCGIGCGARTADTGRCPNPVSKESKKAFLAAKQTIRCMACKCQEADCLTPARRPFGSEIDLSASRGRCMKHWKKK